MGTDSAEWQELCRFEGHANRVRSVAFSWDALQIVSGSSDCTIVLWDVPSSQESRRFHGHTRAVWSVAFSRDARRIVSGSDDKTVRLWEAASGAEVHCFEGHTGEVISVAFSVDARLIVSGSRDDTIRLWDVASGTEARRIVGHTASVYCVSFSWDVQQIVSGSVDASIRLWDVASGRSTGLLAGHTSTVWCVAFSWDVKQLVSGSRDTTIRLWEVASGKEVRRFEGHTCDVNSVAFSLDALRIVSGSFDNTIRLWDVASGKELRRFAGHTGDVNSVAFSWDAQQIVSGSEDQSVRLWGVPAALQNPYSQKLTAAKRRAGPAALRISPLHFGLVKSLVALLHSKEGAKQRKDWPCAAALADRQNEMQARLDRCTEQYPRITAWLLRLQALLDGAVAGARPRAAQAAEAAIARFYFACLQLLKAECHETAHVRQHDWAAAEGWVQAQGPLLAALAPLSSDLSDAVGRACLHVDALEAAYARACAADEFADARELDERIQALEARLKRLLEAEQARATAAVERDAVASEAAMDTCRSLEQEMWTHLQLLEDARAVGSASPPQAEVASDPESPLSPRQEVHALRRENVALRQANEELRQRLEREGEGQGIVALQEENTALKRQLAAVKAYLRQAMQAVDGEGS